MSGGGSGTQYPTSILAGQWGGANQAFQPLPYPNTGPAASSAYGDIQNQWTNQLSPWSPSGQAGVGQGITGSANQLSALVPWLTSQAQGAMSRSFPGATTGPGTTGLGALQKGEAQYNLLTPYESRILQAGFDPQNALYNRTLQQVQNQANAENAMAGVATSPYGAGLTNDQTTNFNIDWQNTQLQREQAAAQGASQLSGAAMNAIQTGHNIFDQARSISNQLGTNDAMTQANIANMLLGQAGGMGTNAANIAGAGQQLGQSGASFLNNINAQKIQALLNYLAANTTNASAWLGGSNNAMQAATGLYGTQGQLNNAANQQTMAGLGGLGSLLGAGLNYFAG